MPKKDLEQQTSYPSDMSEATGLEDLHAPSAPPSMLKKLVRLIAGASVEDHDKGRELRRAVRSQDVALVRQMINKGYGVNESQEASLACIAARRANLDMLNLLVEAGVDINRPDRRSQTSKARTPLQEAARKGWFEGVLTLLNMGALVDECEEGDVTALHLAARAGFVDVVRVLLQHRADPCGSKVSITSPLHETASPKIAQMLLSAGAMVNQRDRNKCTPLHLQAYAGRPDVIEVLLKAGADVNSADRKGRPPVFLLGGRGDCVRAYEILKKANSSLRTKDVQENSLAHAIAQRAANFPLLAAVFTDAPDLWFTKNLSGQTPIDILMLRGQNDWVKSMRQRMDHHRATQGPEAGSDIDVILGRNTAQR